MYTLRGLMVTHKIGTMMDEVSETSDLKIKLAGEIDELSDKLSQLGSLYDRAHRRGRYLMEQIDLFTTLEKQRLQSGGLHG